MSEKEAESKLDTIMQERRDKGVALGKAGSNPYRNDVGPKDSIKSVIERFASTKPEPKAPAPAPPPGQPKVKAPPEPIVPLPDSTVRIAGRAVAKRGMGKVVFAPIRDIDSEIQLYLSVEHLSADAFANVLPNLDVGDIVVAEGPVFWTKRGELSVLVSNLWIATKALRPLPSKTFTSESGQERGGLANIEDRYRQRYVDLAIDLDVRAVFRKRSAIVRGIRKFLDDRDFLEVETPMMHPIIGGAAARPFITHHNALDMKLYMRIAPELYLKRLVVGGFDRVYEINRNFRNEGLSRSHNPEFTMLEFYQAYATYTDLMDLTEAMFRQLAQDVNGSTKVTWGGVEIDLAPQFRRLAIKDAVKELGGIADAEDIFKDPALAARRCVEHGVPAADVARVLHTPLGDTHEVTSTALKQKQFDVAATVAARYSSDFQRRVTAGHLGYLLFEATAEAKLVQPTFLTQFPLAVSPLARKNDADPAFCDRFELFVNGKEIANGFSELNDPDDQRGRFQAQLDAKKVGTDETMDYDEDYCRALEVGLPPTAGEGIGIDRLAMLLTGQDSIRDVILFPLMRPE